MIVRLFRICPYGIKSRGKILSLRNPWKLLSIKSLVTNIEIHPQSSFRAVDGEKKFLRSIKAAREKLGAVIILLPGLCLIMESHFPF